MRIIENIAARILNSIKYMLLSCIMMRYYKFYHTVRQWIKMAKRQYIKHESTGA